MSCAVDVLIVDETSGLDSSLRATLEHAPALRTIDEQELGEIRIDGEGPVALVCAREAQLETVCERISALREAHPALRIMVMFRALDTTDLQRLIGSGVNAFVGCGTPAREVCAAIVALAYGLAPLVGGTDPAVQTNGSAEGTALTPREAEVLRFLSAGFSNKEVARRLSLSVRTVETHRLNLRRKTQTGRLKDLVSLARQLGLDPVVDTETSRAARH